MTAYRSNTGTAALESPKVRIYDNTADTWGSEIELSDTNSNIRDVRIKCSPVSAKCIVVSDSADGTLNAWVCTSACGTATSWTDNHQSDFADMWSVEPTNAARSFDVCFEDQSGDALVIYDKVSTVSGEELFYRVMSDAGTTFGSETAIDTQSANAASDIRYAFVRCISDDGSDKIGRVELDRTNNDVNAGIWSGSAMGDNIDVTGTATAVDEEQMGIAWETNSGHLLACGGAGAQVACREYTTSWQTAANVGGVATGVGNVNWLMMKGTPRSAGNEIFLAIGGDLFDFATIQWSGTAWGTGTEHDAGIDGHASRVFDIALSPAADGDSGTVDALLMWGTANNNISYRAWSATNTYGTASSIANTGTHLWIQFPDVANPTSGDSIDSIGGTQDSGFDISRLEWTGNTNAPTDLDDEVTTDTVVNTYEGMSIDWVYQTFTTLFERGVSQSITVGNATSRILSGFRGIDQGITIGNATAAVLILVRGMAQGLTVGDSISELSSFFRSIAQGVTVANALDRLANMSVAITQEVTVGNALSRVALLLTSIADSITVGNALSGLFVAGRVIAQAIGIADSLSQMTTYIRGIADSISLADTLARLQSTSRAIADSLSVGNTLDRLASQFRDFSQTINIGNALARGLSFFTNISQTINVSDLLDRTFILVRNISQSIFLSLEAAFGNFFSAPGGAGGGGGGSGDDCLLFLGKRGVLCI